MQNNLKQRDFCLFPLLLHLSAKTLGIPAKAVWVLCTYM